MVSIKILLCISALSLLGCRGDVLSWQESTYPRAIKIYAPDSESISINKILHETKVVKLECNDASFISAIDKVLIIKNKLFILDEALGRVLKFDSNGNFLQSLIISGNGPRECSSLRGICYNYDDDEILIGCRGKRAILRFDVNGNYLGEIRVKFGVENVAYLGGGSIAISTGYFSDTNHNVFIIDKLGNEIGSAFQFPPDTRTMLFGFLGVLSENINGALYVDATSSEVYQITRDGKTYLKYQIDFEGLQWPEEKKYDFMDFIQHKIGTVSVLRNNIIETDDVLVFNYQDGNKLRVGYFFKKLGKLYTFDNLKVNPFTEILMREGPIGLSGDGYFVSAFSPYEVSDIIQKGKESFSNISPKLYENLAEESEEELNPVLFFYKFSTKL